MNNKVFISCAVTGSGDTASKHPDLPKTPEQIANAAIESAKAGAAIAHIHVREEDGTPSRRLELYKEVVDRIRSSDTDVVLNLTTPISVLEDILPDCYIVLLMSINPGFGGQKFEEITYKKVRKLRQMANNQGLNTHIEIDGGVTSSNARKLLDEGANVLVAGSFIFKSDNPTETIAELKAI